MCEESIVHGTNLEKIDQVNQISREFCNDELTLEQAFKQMKALWKEKEPPKIRLLAFALLTGGFAVMFGSNWAEAIVAAVVGLVGAAVQFSCEKGHMHMFVENIVCSLSVAVAIGFLTAALPGTYDTRPSDHQLYHAFCSGSGYHKCGLCTLHGDYLSGLARAAEAFVIALAVAIGIGMGIVCDGSSPWKIGGEKTMTDMIIQSIGGIAAVYGFARILGVPKKFYLWAGIDGGIGWFVYLLVGAMTHSELLGAFFGAAVISVGANVCARVFKTPVTMILIPANMTLVPGAGMYRIVYHILYPEGEQAAYYFHQTLLMAGMIAIAMFIVNIIWSSVTGSMKKRRDYRNEKVE